MVVKINKYCSEPSTLNLGTNGSFGVETLEFEFSEEWDNLVKNVTFTNANGESVVVILTDNTCSVPFEMTQAKGYGTILVQGTKDGVNLLSLEISAVIMQTGTPSTTPAGSPTPSEMEQVLNIMGETQSIAQSVRNDADEGKFDGAKGEQGEQGLPGVLKTIKVNTLPSSDIDFSAFYLVPVAEDTITDVSEVGQ